MSLCIYRQHNSNIPCCFNNKNNNYCSIHSNNYNIVYDIIDKAIGRAKIDSQQIYIIFKYIYNDTKIFTKEFIFKACLKMLYSDIECLKANYPKMIGYTMTMIINQIYILNLNTYNIEKNHYSKINIIYNFMLKTIIKKHKYNENIILNNNEDPFTLNTINELDTNDLFIYKENNETNYFFIATELKYFIDTNGSWNPYTKQEFSPLIIRNLNYFIQFYKLNKKKSLNKYEWNSIQQAFTDVSQIIEKIGFYNDTRWLLKLTSKQIKNTIKTFKLISREYQDIENFFVNINDNTIFYDFAREIIKLFEIGNDNFILCCNFIKSISLYNDDFYNNIPEWMSDVESPLIINIPANTFNTINTLNTLNNINNIDNINIINNSMDILYFINIMNNE
jgi:virulence-associated protein VapD